MIQLPRNHLADETLARVLVASKRVRARRAGPELEPDDAELVELPPSMMPSAPSSAPRRPEPGTPQPGQAAPGASPELVPPLEESGLDPGLILQGADSFDALLKT